MVVLLYTCSNGCAFSFLKLDSSDEFLLEIMFENQVLRFWFFKVSSFSFFDWFMFSFPRFYAGLKMSELVNPQYQAMVLMMKSAPNFAAYLTWRMLCLPFICISYMFLISCNLLFMGLILVHIVILFICAKVLHLKDILILYFVFGFTVG